MRRSFFGWRPDSLIEPLSKGKVVARILLLGGKNVLLRNAWRVCMRDIFTSVKDLDRKIMRDIRSYNRQAHPIKWSYKDASNRIKPALKSSDTLH